MEPRDLSAHSVYRAGRGIEEVARDLGLDPADLVKLSSNENPFGPSPAAIEAIESAAPRPHTPTSATPSPSSGQSTPSRCGSAPAATASSTTSAGPSSNRATAFWS